MISSYFKKIKKELETPIQTIRIYGSAIGMEFDIEKCAMQTKKSGKSETTEGIELENRENVRTLEEKENYKKFGNFGNGQHQR